MRSLRPHLRPKSESAFRKFKKRGAGRQAETPVWGRGQEMQNLKGHLIASVQKHKITSLPSLLTATRYTWFPLPMRQRENAGELRRTQEVFGERHYPAQLQYPKLIIDFFWMIAGENFQNPDMKAIHFNTSITNSSYPFLSIWISNVTPSYQMMQ